jgi:hypothetical protein
MPTFQNTLSVPSSLAGGCIMTMFNRFQSNFSANSPALICFGLQRGWWITCNYPTVLKEKNIEKQKEYNLRYLLAKVRTTCGKPPDRLRQQTNATKIVSDVFRHRSRTGKSYCRTRFDVGLERVKKCRGIHRERLGSKMA